MLLVATFSLSLPERSQYPPEDDGAASSHAALFLLEADRLKVRSNVSDTPSKNTGANYAETVTLFL